MNVLDRLFTIYGIYTISFFFKKVKNRLSFLYKCIKTSHYKIRAIIGPSNYRAAVLGANTWFLVIDSPYYWMPVFLADSATTVTPKAFLLTYVYVDYFYKIGSI